MKNTNSKRAVIIVSVVVFIVSVVVYLATRKKTEKYKTTDIDETLFPLQKGSSGVYVQALQSWLIQQGATLPKFGTDGNFGDETHNALMSIMGKGSVTYSEFLEIIKTM